MNLVSSLTGFWVACSGRERSALTAAAVVMLAAALYALLWEPGLAARKRLAVTLPALRAQVENMRQQEKEIAALRKKLAAAPQRGDLVTVLRASAARTSFAKAVERVEPLATDRAVLLGSALDFDAWLEWIENLQRELGVRVDACRIVALDQPGLVRVEATFQWGSASAAGKTP